MAREIIDRELHKSELSPADMAARLGVSVRHLLLLFEPTGTSYARYVLGRRLERARLLLVQSPDAAVADIAHACGFQSLATFYRVFRAALACRRASAARSLRRARTSRPRAPCPSGQAELPVPRPVRPRAYPATTASLPKRSGRESARRCPAAVTGRSRALPRRSQSG